MNIGSECGVMIGRSSDVDVAKSSAARSLGAFVTASVAPLSEVSGEYMTWIEPSEEPVRIYSVRVRVTTALGGEDVTWTHLVDGRVPQDLDDRDRKSVV